ncbi:MAG: dTMP kinase [Candidatus Margulisiibacteriota bacterium]|nr:MAG: dTMP kinase [Candidatus Margulisbacteria bacterium GWD2_39_127]OGI02682.1 MAG: dTMP kinase [Candidatus Margulisbacteria bacterium GWF2_38_17]OGI05957.1 MAG: dTMP kinase [Candidatus Margulisbacteria bacterium GWE2_39_32]PZM80031.1 MAG: dTMP kinase [Candidatus Margulisiibacteriota bacterium]HAR63941.1 dTMP kinase [Candidatus Margulisiibacteriota bacterium]
MQEHPYAGKLIVVEGIDGSGKSTQLKILYNFLKSKSYPVILTEWNSSKLVSKVIKKGKKKEQLGPETFSLLHATDFADRLEGTIIPALKAGLIVLADRYAYTAFARDIARNCNSRWVRNGYSFSIKPDAVFYFKVPVKLALDRISLTRTPKYYESGMDMKLSKDPLESFVLFQSKVLSEYEKMVKEFSFIPINATLPIHEQQKLLREDVMLILKKKAKACEKIPTRENLLPLKV